MVTNTPQTLYMPYNARWEISAWKGSTNCPWEGGTIWSPANYVVQTGSLRNRTWGNLNLPAPGSYSIGATYGGRSLTMKVEGLLIGYQTDAPRYVAWAAGGLYPLRDELLTQTYDKSRLVWSIVSSSGDATANIESETGVLHFGQQGGGRYRVRVASRDLPSYGAEKEVNVLKVDLDVDSDNNNGFGAPDRNDAEEQIEDDWQDGFDPLKVVGVNNGDADEDGVVDWADGYNRDGVAGNQDDGLTGKSFVPIVLELPEPLDPATARVKLTYEDSNPAGVTVGGGGGLILPAGYLRIWKKNATDARNKASITSGGDYVPAGTYSASAFGFSTGSRTLTCYLEAVQRSWDWESRRILLEVDPNDASTEPGFICSDAVRISAIRILFRQEIDNSTWLWDWDQEKDAAGNVTAIHSPAYIFGKEDNIVSQIDGAPQGLGNSYFKMNVGTSVSYPAGVDLDLHEDTSRPGVYRNTSTAPSRLIRLGPSTVFGTDFVELKIKEEEDLVGKLKKASGTELGCEGRVMVDRGEYGAGADPGPGNAWKPTTQKFRTEMQKPRVNWHEAGYNDSFTEADLAAFRAFLKNAGSTTAEHGESDLLYYGGHGNDDGNLQMEDSNGDGIYSVILNGNGIANGSDWNDDVEWFYSDACLSLHNIAQQGPPEHSTGDGYKTWTEALFGNPKPAHMVLGHWDVVDDCFGRSSAIVDDFFDHAAGDPPSTIVDAWFHANSDGWEDQECAIVAHADNVADRLKQVTRDTASTSIRIRVTSSHFTNGRHLFNQSAQLTVTYHPFFQPFQCH